MNLDKIIQISGKQGLFKVLNQSASFLIVEQLLTTKKQRISLQSQINFLKDIKIFTSKEEMEIKAVFELLETVDKQNFSFDKKNKEACFDFMMELIPNLDMDKFYPFHAKKIIDWYEILSQTIGKTLPKENEILASENLEDKIENLEDKIEDKI